VLIFSCPNPKPSAWMTPHKPSSVPGQLIQAGVNEFPDWRRSRRQGGRIHTDFVANQYKAGRIMFDGPASLKHLEKKNRTRILGLAGEPILSRENGRVSLPSSDLGNPCVWCWPVVEVYPVCGALNQGLAYVQTKEDEAKVKK
jgi:hypothetical protein